jgi:hypothetical protein
MQCTAGCVASSVANDCILGVEASQKMTLSPVKYVRTAALPSTEDLHLYDLGKVSIATMGCPTATANVGELYISYDITYYKPVTLIGSLIEGARWYSSAGANISSAPMGTACVANYNTLGAVPVLSAAYIEVTLPAGTAGEYMIGYNCTAGAAVAINSYAVAYTNCAALNFTITAAGGYSSTLLAPANTISTNPGSWYVSETFKITNPAIATTIRITPTVGAGGGLTTAILWMAELPAPYTIARVVDQAFRPQGLGPSIEEPKEEEEQLVVHGAAASAASAMGPPPPALQFRKR